MTKNIRNFFKTTIWEMKLENLPVWKRASVKLIKIIVFSLTKLGRDELQMKAPALAFFSLLALVPTLAMVFGIAKGFGLQNVLEAEIESRLALGGELESRLIEFAQSTLQNARGGLIAGLGLVFLFVVIMLVLSNIEYSFNRIWGLRRARSFSIKIRDYFSMIFIGTLLLLISLSLTVALADVPSFFGYLGNAVKFLINLIPYIIVWLLFAFMIIFMPNRRVGFKAGLLAGVISGTLYQLFLNFYIRLQITVSVYNAVYGSFAALPLLLLWMQISWLCLLFGAEVSYAYENVNTRGFHPDYSRISIRGRKLICVWIMQHLVSHFKKPSQPCTAAGISRELEIPAQLVNESLEGLIKAGLVSEVVIPGEDHYAYQPAVSPSNLTLKMVLDAFEEQGLTDMPIKDTPQVRKIKNILEEYDGKLEKSDLNTQLSEL